MQAAFRSPDVLVEDCTEHDRGGSISQEESSTARITGTLKCSYRFMKIGVAVASFSVALCSVETRLG